MIFANLCFIKAKLVVMFSRSDDSKESMGESRSGPLLILPMIPSCLLYYFFFKVRHSFYCHCFIFKYLFIYLFRLCRVLVDSLAAACRILVAARVRDLVPPPGIKLGPPALGAWSPTHWTIREVPIVIVF